MNWANFVGFDSGWSGDALWWETWKMWAQFDEKVKRTRSGGNRKVRNREVRIENREDSRRIFDAVSRIWSKPAQNDVISSGAKAHTVK
jgi:hypothetical protein